MNVSICGVFGHTFYIPPKLSRVFLDLYRKTEKMFQYKFLLENTARDGKDKSLFQLDLSTEIIFSFLAPSLRQQTANSSSFLR